MRRRRAFEGQEWASRDTTWVLLFVGLLVVGIFYPVSFYAALLVALAFVVVLVVRARRRRRAARANDDAPYWIDRIRPPSDS